MENYEPNKPISGDFNSTSAAKCINGTFVGKHAEGVVEFRGIPFAKAPVGDLRWRKPSPVEASDGVFEAVHNAPTSIQTELDSERASFYFQSEDCLYLNVWTAEGFKDEKRPVMVFIHGGNYGWGGTVDPLYSGYNFVKAHPEVVLVTIAYRVGIMGFMDFSEVPGGEDFSDSGNLGLLDQICALKYIRENIAAFGGDPSNVTIFGESAGAGSVSLLPLIPDAKGLFSRVIAESGTVALTYSREECLPLTKLFLKVTGAKSMEDLCAMTEEQIIEANKKLKDINNFPERDGVVLPTDLYNAYDKGDELDVDMLTGSNADELRYWILDVGGILVYRHLGYSMFNSISKMLEKEDVKRAKAFLKLQRKKGVHGRPWQITEFLNDLLFRLPAIKQLESHSKNGNRTYLYFWDYPSSIPHLKACHAVELAYVFNNLEDTIYTGKTPDPVLADTVQRMWVNFAKCGDPSIEGAEWPQYSEKTRNTMILGSHVRTENGWKEEERECLEPLLKYCLNGNFTSSSLKD